MSNKIKIFSEKIGEFEINVTDDQLEKLIKDGAKALNKVREDRKWRTPGDSYGSSKIENGFVGNTENWVKYFPQVSSQEIDKLIDKALDHEKKVRTATSAALVLVGVGISAALTSNPASILGLVKVVQILGTYFSSEE